MVVGAYESLKSRLAQVSLNYYAILEGEVPWAKTFRYRGVPVSATIA
jgi:hypothetical protein